MAESLIRRFNVKFPYSATCISEPNVSDFTFTSLTPAVILDVREQCGNRLPNVYICSALCNNQYTFMTTCHITVSGNVPAGQP